MAVVEIGAAKAGACYAEEHLIAFEVWFRGGGLVDAAIFGASEDGEGRHSGVLGCEDD